MFMDIDVDMIGHVTREGEDRGIERGGRGPTYRVTKLIGIDILG